LAAVGGQLVQTHPNSLVCVVLGCPMVDLD
jgi:hypothetical protein